MSATFTPPSAEGGPGVMGGARPLSEKMAGMAEAAKDQQTLATVRARLVEKP